MTKVVINQDVCIKCGLCASVNSEVFQFDAENNMQALTPAPEKLAEVQPSIDQAINGCPVMAISWEEETTVAPTEELPKTA